MKHLVIDLTIVIILLVAICTVGKAAETTRSATKPKAEGCYATCRQFESALLVGCYLADFEGRSEPNRAKRLKNFNRHENFCRNLVKELMGKDSGCK